MDSLTPPTYEIFRDKHGIPQFSPKRGTRALINALSYAFPTLETELELMQAALQKFFVSEKRVSGTFICELPENNLQASLKDQKDDVESPLPSAVAFLRSWKVALEPQRGARAGSRSSSRVEGRTPALTSRNTSRASSRCGTPVWREPDGEVLKGSSMTTWSLSSGQEIEKKKRTPYDPVKRRKVAENRGNACEKHRLQKTACDPSSCPQNKLYSKASNCNKPESSFVNSEAEFPKSNQRPGVSRPELQTSTSSFLVEDKTLLIGSEDFWDSSFCNPMPVQSHTSQTSTMTRTSSSHSTRTTTYDESPYSNPDLSDSHISSGLHFNNSSTALLGLDSLLDETPAWKSPEDNTPWQISTEPQPTLEDPFMGWGDKRASQNLGEYEWVVEHL
ncbi:hypothetical protein HYALB_00002727 [Hymenoscyphus albidus]|uniref:Uncharacterized protein n=1 Tax=Hymenoscyphus albidus TaxID=595503 RepID=A0A9N9M241_9HELO|nr:hypothetical protein HYALB_00002727 [Hymenoscyphus albidus]